MNQATIFGYYVKDPERFGIVEFNRNRRALSVEEKPKTPKSNYCITGLYFYPQGVSRMAHKIKPSARGELEITDFNRLYLNENRLKVQILGHGHDGQPRRAPDGAVSAGLFAPRTKHCGAFRPAHRTAHQTKKAPKS